MVRIAGVAAGANAPRRAARASGGFRLPETEAAATAAVPAGEGLAALLAMQESGGVAEAEQRARRRGQRVLDALRDLQLGMLRGGVDQARLEALAALAETAGEIADPALRAVLAEIALRARVELARHRAVSRRSMGMVPHAPASAM
jgi:hypothetical protein